MIQCCWWVHIMIHLITYWHKNRKENYQKFMKSKKKRKKEMQKMHSYNLIHHTNHCLVLPKHKQIHFNWRECSELSCFGRLLLSRMVWRQWRWMDCSTQFSRTCLIWVFKKQHRLLPNLWWWAWWNALEKLSPQPTFSIHWRRN